MKTARDIEPDGWVPSASSRRGKRIETFVRRVLAEEGFLFRLAVSPEIAIFLGDLSATKERIVVGFPHGAEMAAANEAATGRRSPPSAKEFAGGEDAVAAWVAARRVWHQRRREVAADWLACVARRLRELGCEVSEEFDSHGTLHSLTVVSLPKGRKP